MRGRWHDVIRAVCHWLAVAARAGKEFDLTKAFDNAPRAVSEVAMEFRGAPAAVAALLLLGRRGQRVCCVDGALAEPIDPHGGLPQGDPSSPNVLEQVLAP